MMLTTFKGGGIINDMSLNISISLKSINHQKYSGNGCVGLLDFDFCCPLLQNLVISLRDFQLFHLITQRVKIDFSFVPNSQFIFFGMNDQVL